MRDRLGDLVGDGPFDDAVPADRPDLVGDVGGLAVAIAEFLGRLHRLPTEGFPFDVGWDALAARVEAAGRDAAELPEPYNRYETAKLRELWSKSRPDVEDLVVCHGQPELAGMRFHAGNLVGIGTVDRLCVADRHLDLAIAQQSLQRALGPESVFVFYDAYPFEPDLVRLDHYVLASLLGG